MTLSLKNAYTVAPDDLRGVNNLSWVAECFDVVDSHRVVQTFVKMQQNATLFEGSIRAAFYASDGTKPTGAPLITKWLDFTGLTTSWPPDTFLIDWGGGIALSTGWYALVFSGYFIDAVNHPAVASKMASAGPRKLVTSSDQGANWSTSNDDMWFENWGDNGTAYGPSPSWLASHPDIVALWRCEPWDLFSDQSGKGNHFTIASYARPNTAVKEGSGSLYLATGRTQLPIAGQSADFALRNSTYNEITVAAWFNVAAGDLPASGNRRDILNKGTVYKNFRLCVYNDAGTCKIQVGHGYGGGASWEYCTLDTVTIAEGVWYHVTVVYNATTHACTLRLLVAGVPVSVAATWSEDLNYNDDVWWIGGGESSSRWVGWIDELAVFNKIIPPDDIEKIEGLGGLPKLDKKQHKWQCW